MSRGNFDIFVFLEGVDCSDQGGDGIAQGQRGSSLAREGGDMDKSNSDRRLGETMEQRIEGVVADECTCGIGN